MLTSDENSKSGITPDKVLEVADKVTNIHSHKIGDQRMKTPQPHWLNVNWQTWGFRWV